MKLNIGCGPFYLKGYINIDAFNKQIADEFHYSWLLPYKSTSIDEITSFQLIEHLGYIESLYSISEWYRVLRDKGKLIIETVNLEKTLKNKPLDKNWLLGLDYQGMTHKYCFDEKEIINVLVKMGFSQIKIIKKTLNKKPILRIEGMKTMKESLSLLYEFKRELIKEKIINLSKINKEDFAYEDIFNSVIEILENNNSKIHKIVQLLQLLSSFNPKISKLFFLLTLRNNFFKNKEKIQRAILVSEQLEIRQFIKHLSYLFYKTKKSTGLSFTIFERIKSLAYQYIENLFNDVNKDKLLSLGLTIWSKQKPQTFLNKIKNFSTQELSRLGSIFEIKGIKYVSQNKINLAINSFSKAIKLDSEKFLSYWNLARLYLIKKDIPKAIINYEKTYETAPQDFKKELIKEMTDIMRNNEINKYLTVKQNVYY